MASVVAGQPRIASQNSAVSRVKNQSPLTEMSSMIPLSILAESVMVPQSKRPVLQKE